MSSRPSWFRIGCPRRCRLRNPRELPRPAKYCGGINEEDPVLNDRAPFAAFSEHAVDFSFRLEPIIEFRSRGESAPFGQMISRLGYEAIPFLRSYTCLPGVFPGPCRLFSRLNPARRFFGTHIADSSVFHTYSFLPQILSDPVVLAQTQSAFPAWETSTACAAAMASAPRRFPTLPGPVSPESCPPVTGCDRAE